MSPRLRSLLVAAAVATVAVPAGVAAAGPAAASGGHGTCTLVSTHTLPGITTSKTFTVLSSGTVTIRRDAAHDMLTVRSVTASTGWSASVEVRHGPKVVAQWRKGTRKVELEAAQSAQYYGPNILVTGIKTCTL